MNWQLRLLIFAMIRKTILNASSLSVSAYHKIVPLENKEVSIIYYLIAAKLCISVCQSAYAKKHDPENIYASSSEANAWKMLHKLLEINPIAFEDAIRKQIGFERKKKRI